MGWDGLPGALGAGLTCLIGLVAVALLAGAGFALFKLAVVVRYALREDEADRGSYGLEQSRAASDENDKPL